MEKNNMYLFTDLKMDYPVDLDRKSRNADVLFNMHHHTQMSSEPQEIIKWSLIVCLLLFYMYLTLNSIPHGVVMTQPGHLDSL